MKKIILAGILISMHCYAMEKDNGCGFAFKRCLLITKRGFQDIYREFLRLGKSKGFFASSKIAIDFQQVGKQLPDIESQRPVGFVNEDGIFPGKNI